MATENSIKPTPGVFRRFMITFWVVTALSLFAPAYFGVAYASNQRAIEDLLNECQAPDEFKGDVIINPFACFETSPAIESKYESLSVARVRTKTSIDKSVNISGVLVFMALLLHAIWWILFGGQRAKS